MKNVADPEQVVVALVTAAEAVYVGVTWVADPEQVEVDREGAAEHV